MRTAVIPRAEFLAERWAYEPGQHVTVLGPTRSGKTHLAYQLLGRTASERLPAMVLVMKPRDRTVSAFTKDLGFTRVADWPPQPNPFRKRPPGWTVWPRHTFDPEEDDEMMAAVFRRAIIASYKRGDRIIFADEVAGLTEELGMKRLLNGVWARGGAMGTGLWSASQRPAYVPLHAYSQAYHLFLTYDPDLNSRKRFAEIGGIDPAIVLRDTAALQRYHFLYIRRDGRRCIITP